MVLAYPFYARLVLGWGHAGLFLECPVKAGLGIETHIEGDVQYGLIGFMMDKAMLGCIDPVCIDQAVETCMEIMVEKAGELMGFDTQLMRKHGKGEFFPEIELFILEFLEK